MTLSVLLVESDVVHASASAEGMADQRADWHIELASTVAQARRLLEHGDFDAVLVSDFLSDGAAFDLVSVLAGRAVILCVKPGAEPMATQAMRQGFVHYLVQDAALSYVATLALRVELAIRENEMARQLRNSLERFEIALDGAGQALWERHLLTGSMIVNERWKAILGYDSMDNVLSAEVWQGLVHPDDWLRVMAANQANIDNRVPEYTCEYRLHHKKTDRWIWVRSRGRVVERDASGKALRMLGTFMDITESRLAVEAAGRQHGMLQAISRAQGLFITSIDAATVFEGVLRDLLCITQSHCGFVAEVHFDAGLQPRMTIQTVAGQARADAAGHQRMTLAIGQRIRADHKTLLGATMALGEPVIVNEPAQDVRWQADSQACGMLQAFLGIPVHNDGELVAVVGLADRPGGYSQADVDFLDPLCNTIGQLVQARRSDAERRRVETELESARTLLEQKAQALEMALDSMPHGLSQQNADGRITLYNQRFLAMLDLPEALLRQQPTIAELIRFRNERGDFGENMELLDAAGQDYCQLALVSREGKAPDSYMHRTRDGRMLEVRSKALADGGMVQTYIDMTDFFSAQAALRESEARFRSLTNLSSDWYWEQDEQFRFVRIEGSEQSRLGMADVAAVGMTRWELQTYNVTEAQWQEHRKALNAHQVFRNFEMERATTDGSKLWVSIDGEPILDAAGVFKGYRGVGRNITGSKLAAMKIERLAFFDELTGLPNRRMLTDRLQKALAIATRSRNRGALLFIDLDNFKDLNDTRGHDVGDLLLQQVATRLRGCVREADTVARLGGDEFVVMLDELSPVDARAAAQAELVGRKVLNALNQDFELLGVPHHSTPSIGITLFHEQLQNVDELLKRADLAMYQAKAAGRNTMRFFDPVMQAAVSARAGLEADLRKGLSRKELLLHYQPVVDAAGSKIGVEALVRWQHPERGLVPPMEFIPMAEQTGLILPLGEWVLRTACELLVVWSRQPQTSRLSMAVNVSARQFRQSDFAEQVEELLRTTGANPFRLKLELTESLLLSDVEDAIAKMSQLRALGVSFSLDDFGTGYSSLSYLKRLPLDQLKIDQSFVRDVLTDPNDAAIVRTILALARSMELTVVAEGVETPGQREFLARNGCMVFQGYLFGHPVPVEALQLDSPQSAGGGPIPQMI